MLKRISTKSSSLNKYTLQELRLDNGIFRKAKMECLTNRFILKEMLKGVLQARNLKWKVRDAKKKKKNETQQKAYSMSKLKLSYYGI